MVFEKKPQPQPIHPEMLRTSHESKRRIRVLEQDVDAVRSRLNAIEEKMIEDMGNIKKWLDQLSSDVNEVSKSLKDINSNILRINKDLDKKARKTELRELESLLEIYSPIKSHFITKDQVERMMLEGKKKT
jgi:uncharacterized protein YoxC